MRRYSLPDFREQISSLLFEGHFHHQYMLDTLSREFPDLTEYQINNAIRRMIRKHFECVCKFDQEIGREIPENHVATRRGKLIDRLEALATEIELMQLQSEWRSMTIDQVKASQKGMRLGVIMANERPVDELLLKLFSGKESDAELLRLFEESWQKGFQLRDLMRSDLAARYEDYPALEEVKEFESEILQKISKLLLEGHFHHTYILDTLSDEFPDLDEFDINRRLRVAIRNHFEPWLSSVELSEHPVSWVGQESSVLDNEADIEEALAKRELLELKLHSIIYRDIGLISTDRDNVRVTLMFLGYKPTYEAIRCVMSASDDFEKSMRGLLSKKRSIQIQNLKTIEEIINDKYGD